MWLREVGFQGLNLQKFQSGMHAGYECPTMLQYY